MSNKRIGIAVTGTDSAAVVAAIKRAESLGISAVWLTTGQANPDGLTIFAGAAVSTQNVMLGTSITPIFPRHPLVMAQQVQVLDKLSAGRFRLGIGTSHRPSMVENFGMDFHAPLGHLREYINILKTLFSEGSVDFHGEHYTAQASIPSTVDVPVMASALGESAFELCGAEADGAISWVCPGSYLGEVAVPAIKRGADRAGRPAPLLIAHAPVCVHDNPAEVKEAMRGFGRYPQLPFYQNMFVAAGFPEAQEGSWSDGMIDATVLSGNESQVTEKLESLFAIGATEVLASPVAAGNDQAASLDRTLRLLAKAGQSVNA